MVGIKDLAMDISYEMGFDGIIDFAMRSVAEQVIMVMKLARKIRKERMIRVCAWHESSAWFDGEDWVTDRPIPPGRQTHTMCPECYEKRYEVVKI